MNIKKIIVIALISFFALILSSSKRYSQSKTIIVFRLVAEKLISLKQIKYHYAREFNYRSEDYISNSDGDMYVDFSRENDMVGFRYQYTDSSGFSIFNNSEIFDGNIKDKTIEVINKLNPKSFEGRSALFNSIITLRNALPGIINDRSISKSLTDTLIHNKSFYLLQFVLQNKLLNYLGTGFRATTMELTFNYRLIVDKMTLLPISLLQTTISSHDLSRTDFSNMNIHPPIVDERSWYYSSYLNQYVLQQPQKKLVPIKTGETAPEWSLTNYATDAKEILSQYKGKVVLMEFWIKNCGYCIEAVSKLNELNEIYKLKNFKILAINTEDNKKNISNFVASHHVKYTIMYSDNSTIDKDYGIEEFPEVILIDKSGRVIYTGDCDTSKLKMFINQNI